MEKIRNDFEQWYLNEVLKLIKADLTQIVSMRDGDKYEIKYTYLNACWTGWKASHNKYAEGK